MTSRSGAGHSGRKSKHQGIDDDETLTQTLDRLRANHWGVDFIYEAMAILTARFSLHDVLIVIDVERVDTLVFRLGGRAVSPDRTEFIGQGPGVYCDPPIVPGNELRILFEACQTELARPRTIGQLTHSSTLPRRTPGSSPTARLHERLNRPLERITIGEGDDDWWAEPHQGGAFTRLALSRFLLFVDVASLLMALMSFHGPIRFVIGLVLGVAVPGWSIVGLMRLRNSPLEVGLTMALSFSIILVSAQILVTAHLWHLVGFEMALCLACLPSLWKQSRRQWMNEGNEQ